MFTAVLSFENKCKSGRVDACPHVLILFQFRESGQSAWVYFIQEKISADATSFVMRNLTANSTYLIKLAAKNE
jgi:hypothetical protein